MSLRCREPVDVLFELVSQIVRVSAEEWKSAHDFHRHDRVKLTRQLLRWLRVLARSRCILQVCGRGLLPCDTRLASVAFDGAHTLDVVFMLVGLALSQDRRVRLTSTSIDDLLG